MAQMMFRGDKIMIIDDEDYYNSKEYLYDLRRAQDDRQKIVEYLRANLSEKTVEELRKTAYRENCDLGV
jgi:hypothetical protein